MRAVRVPLLNANEEELEVIDVSVQEGAEVKSGQVLFVVESTKATVEVEAPSAGFVRKLSVAKGQRAKVNDLLCVITATPTEVVEISEPVTSESAGGFRVTRKAQELADRHGLDLMAAGLTGIIKESDVEKCLEQQANASGLSRREPLRLPDGTKKPIVIYGARGHARVLIDLMRLAGEFFPIGALDDGAVGEALGVPVIGTSAILERLRSDGVEMAALGIGSVQNHSKRAGLYRKLVAAGFSVPNLLHPRAMVEPSVSMGAGNQIFAGAIVGSATKLGENTIINSGTVVSHDCVIESNTHLSPGAILAGGVHVGENTLVGMGVTIYLGLRIGSNVVIGNGSHILKDVPDGAVVRAAP
jgi:sugar O-acyltransferase (sialic acid O-acetyltransferase NeuD family)